MASAVHGGPLGAPAHGPANLDEIELAADVRPASRANADEHTTEKQEMGRIHRIWHDLLFSDKSASAVTTLHSYGYFISILMTLWGWNRFTDFGLESSICTKFVIQIIGLNVSVLGVYACYMDQPKVLSLFFAYQLTHAILIFFGLYYMFRTSRGELYADFVTEPFYNIKLVDYPFGKEENKIDMSAEPAYEISLLYYRALYMLIVTNVFNIYTLYSVGRKLWNQPLWTRVLQARMHRSIGGGQNIDQGDRVQIEEINATTERRISFSGKVGLLLGS